MKKKMKWFLKKLLCVVLIGFIIFGIGLVIAYWITDHYDSSLQEVVFMEGLLILIIGILASMKGNPSGSSISGIGLKNENAMSFQNLEATRLERERNPYDKNFLKNSIVEFVFSSVALMIGGAMLMGYCILFLS